LPTPASLRESGSAVVEFKITEDKSILLVYAFCGGQRP